MSSTPERQSSWNDFVEVTSPTFPLSVSAAFTGRTPTVTVARAFSLIGATAFTVKTSAGQTRTRTAGVSSPFFVELKITEIVDAPGATAVILYE